MFNPSLPYNELPSLPPSRVVETPRILKICIEARAALAELKTAGEMIPNQAMLIHTLPILEAKDSSAIENIVTTTDSLFESLDSGRAPIDPATKEALQYRAALFEGAATLKTKPLSTSTAIQVCSTLKGRPMEIRRIPGTTLASDKVGSVIYTPPVGEALIREKLSNLEQFLHNHTDLDPLIRMAVGHYQFEAIHPFLDGNGRTGRIFNLLFLVEVGLLHQPILYLSRYLIRHKTTYYELLLCVTREGAWEEWAEFILEGVRETALWTIGKITAMRSLQEAMAVQIKAQAPKIYSNELLDILFTQPYSRIHQLMDKGLAKRETASIYLKQLVELGFLQEVKSGREKVFINYKLMEILKS